MFCKGLLLQIKADWAEFSHSLGFPAWNTTTAPCVFCVASTQNWHSLTNFSPISFPWHLNSQADYNSSCTACEIQVKLTTEWKVKLTRWLVYDRRPNGSRGRALDCDVPELHLKKGDRVEPCHALSDPADFESLECPATVTFWRRAKETRVRRRNPIFSVPGVGLLTMQVDILHCLFLGPCLDFIAQGLWLLVDYDSFCTGASTIDSKLLITVLRIRGLLWVWYKDQKKLKPDKDITRLEDLTVGMMGTSSSRTFKCKAVEAKHLVPFVVCTLTKFMDSLGEQGRRMWRVGLALVEFIDLLDAMPKVARETSTIQRLYDCFNSFHRYWRNANLPLKPKLHMLSHLVQRTAEHGSPNSYATFTDEGINRTLANIGRAAHRSVWELRVLDSFQRAESVRVSKLSQ
jgi:hypothetical protein